MLLLDGLESIVFQIGAHIRRVTADQIKKVSLELGGKNPAIVFGDADIDKGKDITPNISVNISDPDQGLTD